MDDQSPITRPSTRVEVRTELEASHGWSYAVVVHGEGAPSEHTVTLAWCDHDYWCGGRCAPSRVVQAVVEFAIAAAKAPLPPKFDAARVRRWAARADEEIKSML